MVHIVDFKQRKNSATGETFNVLVLEGDLEMVQSTVTGRYYATAKRATVTSTFNEETCRRLIGRSMPGSVVKQACDPYDYTIEKTGEVITLTHRYAYSPTGQNEDAVFGPPESALVPARVPATA